MRRVQRVSDIVPFFFFFALAKNLKCMSKAFKGFSQSKIKGHPFRPSFNTLYITHWT